MESYLSTPLTLNGREAAKYVYRKELPLPTVGARDRMAGTRIPR